MRLSRSLSLALFSATLVSSSQILDQPSNNPNSFFPWPHRPRTTTIIDLLSTSTEFTPLIRALQRAELIPILNSADNVTLIAPMREAFEAFGGDISRELLLYHCLNGSVLSDMVEGEIVMESLLTMDDGDGGNGNRSRGVGVRIERQGDRGRGQGKLLMGGVARVVKSDWEANNVIQVVDKFMRIPNTIDSILRDMEDLSTFQELFFKETILPPSYSIFVPDNSAFDILHPAELSYLKTPFAKQDRINLVHRHASTNITYVKNLVLGGSIPSLEGEIMHYKQREEDIFVDGANITQKDIVARNGVIHVISKLLLPDSVIFTPLKYLYGLGDIIFAETLAASDSFPLANDSSISQTILAPVDSAYADSVDIQRTELLKQVEYNFLDEKIDLKQVEDGELLKTKYDLKSLKGSVQRIKVTKRDGKILLNNGIEVISDAVHAGNTTIYSIKENLTPPGPLRPTSSQGMDLFRSFRHIVSMNLDQRILFDEIGITALLPIDQAWKDLGLTEKYLLSSSAGDSLKRILLSCILRGVHYFNSFPREANTFKTIEGDEVALHFDGKDIVFDSLDGVKGAIDEKDILANNGVGHSLSFVPIPKSVTITPENLINATNQSKWFQLLKNNVPQYLQHNSTYTLLIPLDTTIPSSLALQDLLPFHIIPPTPSGPVDLLHLTTSNTLNGHPLKIHKIYDNTYTIGINRTAGSYARVLDQGKTSCGTQILLIDMVLIGPVEKGGWTLARVLAVGLTAVAVSVCVAGGVGWGVRVWQRRREGKPLFVGGEETEGLLNGNGA